MAVALARIAYTQYRKHHTEPMSLPLAVNRSPSVSRGSVQECVFEAGLSHDEKARETFDDLKQPTQEVRIADDSDDEHLNHETHAFPGQSVLPTLSKDYALYPQYITSTPTVITISEVSIPHRAASFSVYNSSTPSEPLFEIHRSRPSLSGRQQVIDSRTLEPVMTIRRVPGTLPPIYTLSDASETTVLSLEGKASIPTQGTKGIASFTNAVDLLSTKLEMRGSWRNRSAIIRDSATGETLAAMQSELLNVKNLVGRRRTYTVMVNKGVDVAMVVGMFVALDGRAA